MTEVDGHQILLGLAETRKFFEQVSLLVRTAEDSLGTEGWEPLFGNKCATNSPLLHRPKQWMPAEVYRFFVAGEDSEGNKDTVIFIGVLIDNEGAWGGFQEPWITCGIFRFNTDTDVTKFDHRGWIWSHLDDKHDADGIFHDWESTPEKVQENDGLVYEATMALPLVSIDSAESLKHKI
ncbi:MAG: hypothetical protein Q7R57_01835, partial [Dehalococcoidales bacterium]|nr:hypothetical protein [Dehalococcoidales bacterium]